jgi:hypothetical protein
VNFTSGCGAQNFVKTVKVVHPETGDVRVMTMFGSRESWYEDNVYEFVLYLHVSCCDNNNYDMFQPLLVPENCVGLEFVGNSKGNSGGDVPMWVGLFKSPDPRYKLTEGVKFSLTNEYVLPTFSRYVEMAIHHPNVMLDLLQIASQDRDYVPHGTSSVGWHLTCAETRGKPKFRYWKDRPSDLVSEVQGCVKNIFQLMYVPGGRWRFFGRFNHDLDSVVRTWYQMDEAWMTRYLKPQCVKDMFETAVPFKKVNVHKTGKFRPSSAKLKCVQDVVLAFVPPDDLAVIEEVSGWDDEVDFRDKVGRLYVLSAVSQLYSYNATKVPAQVMLYLFVRRNDMFFLISSHLPWSQLTTQVRNDMFENYPWNRDVNIVLRPAGEEGPCCSLAVLNNVPITCT